MFILHFSLSIINISTSVSYSIFTRGAITLSSSTSSITFKSEIFPSRYVTSYNAIDRIFNFSKKCSFKFEYSFTSEREALRRKRTFEASLEASFKNFALAHRTPFSKSFTYKSSSLVPFASKFTFILRVSFSSMFSALMFR